MSHVCSAPPLGVGAFFSFPRRVRRGENGRVRTLLMQPVNGAENNAGAIR